MSVQKIITTSVPIIIIMVMAVYNLWLTLEVNLRELTSVPPWISVKMEEKRQKYQIPQFGTAGGKNEHTQNYCQVMDNNN